jgi:hypothetical protein
VPGLGEVVEIAKDITQTCVLRSDDSVWCWGIGMTVRSDRPVAVPL